MSIWRDYTSENSDVHQISRMGLTHSVYLVRSIWVGPCNGFGDLQGRSLEAIPPIDVTTVGPQDPLLWG